MMNKMIVFCLLLVISSMTTAQISRNEKVDQLQNREEVRVTEIKTEIVKLEFPNGRTLYKNISDYNSLAIHNQITYSPNFDSTIIDLTNIDTTLYYHKYSFWQEVPVGSMSGTFLLIGDVNNNKYPELYGQMKNYTTDYTDIVIFEMNQQNSFDSIYRYDSTSIARSIFDIDGDGMEELHLRRFADNPYPYPGNSYLFYKKASFDSLAKILSFIFYYPYEPFITQQNDNKFGDWDGDEFTDQIFHILSIGMFIFEYNPSTPKFDSVYFYDYTPINLEFAGFSIGDYDEDGKTEFFSGSTHGDVLCIENNGNNSYEPTWTGLVETYNAYQLAQTNDIDGNGKKEIWVGGDAFYPGIGPMTRITLFEADGNDNYWVVGRIDLVGVFSFFAQNYQAVDVDKDGIDEMMVCIEQTVLILKFNGSQNHQTYELFYIKQNDWNNNNLLYYGATMFDLTGDGKEEILINMSDDPPGMGTIKWLNHIYKPEFTIDVNDTGNEIPMEFNLYPNYPNPFNPATKIRFDIPEYSRVSVKVYNILGKEITTLLEKNLSPGSYNISWEARDSNGKLLPSGVYLIQLKAGIYTKSIKAVLLK